MADPILPIVDDAIARGILRLKELRPNATPFIISGEGTYADVFAGFRAQLLLLRRRLADEVKSRRLNLAEGKALIELAASEFFAEIVSEPQTAVGTVLLRRPTLDGGAGLIPVGTRFRRVADPNAKPLPVTNADYVSTAPVAVTVGSVDPLDDQLAAVPIAAVGPGADSNIVAYKHYGSALLEIADPLFDDTFEVSSNDAAGGSDGVRGPELIAFAKARYVGQYGPTQGALIAGALSTTGVKHVAAWNDTDLGRAVLFIADQSWAWSQTFQNQCLQVLKEKWVGWGARVALFGVQNYAVTLSSTVILADPKFGDDTTDLQNAIRTAVQKYFDNRPDFYAFDVNSLGGVIARCDPRILTCTNVVLANPVGGGDVERSNFADSQTAFHYVLPGNGITLNIERPG